MTSSAWAMLPDAIEAFGMGGSPNATFATLQHPWSWNEEGPRLGRRKRAKLGELALQLPKVHELQRSADGATKLLLGYGGERIEAVHMPRQVTTSRVTICLSSQIGCAMGCAFCATARLAFRRHLTAGEIVAQLLVILQHLGPRHPSELSVVFMGMGEPLHNLDQVLKAVEVLVHPQGLGLSPRRITLSTSGLVPELERLSEAAVRPLLAVSLNATTDALRQQLMPIGRRYPLAELARALSSYPLRPRERIMVEYVLLAGVNDSEDDARRLADFVAGFPHHVNLVRFNESMGIPFERPSQDRIDAFARTVLQRRPTVVTVRHSRGADVAGACGQLAQRQVTAGR